MLVLGRRELERIVIGDNIVISVMEIRPSLVKLGIECPKMVPVDRQEIRDQKLAEGIYDGTKYRPEIILYDGTGNKVVVQWVAYPPYLRVTKLDSVLQGTGVVNNAAISTEAVTNGSSKTDSTDRHEDCSGTV